MKFINPTTLLWLLRQIVQFGGAYLVFKGYLSEDDAGRAVEAIFTIGGPIVLLVGLAGNVVATFRTKVVVGGQSVGKDAIADTLGTPAAKAVVNTAKEAIANKPTLWESWFGRR